ncbi:MAG: hypothetical protein ABSF24_02390 [Candidatus Bathyarchaeia archaeon]|jgi:hypothetical protein
MCPYCLERFTVPLRVPPRVLKDKKALEEYVHKFVFPRISAQQRTYLKQFFTVVFADGFESGNFNAWTGTHNWNSGVTTVENANPHHGIYNMKITGLTALNDGGSAYKDLGSPVAPEIYVRAYIKLSAMPTADGTPHMFGPGWGLVGAGAGTWDLLPIIEKSGANLYWGLSHWEGAGVNYLESSPSNPVANTWYCVEVYDYLHVSAGIIRLWVDGVLKVEKTGLNTTQRDTSVHDVRLAAYLNAAEAGGITMYGDYFVAADQPIGLEWACMGLTGGLVFQKSPP